MGLSKNSSRPVGTGIGVSRRSLRRPTRAATARELGGHYGRRRRGEHMAALLSFTAAGTDDSERRYRRYLAVGTRAYYLNQVANADAPRGRYTPSAADLERVEGARWRSPGAAPGAASSAARRPGAGTPPPATATRPARATEACRMWATPVRRPSGCGPGSARRLSRDRPGRLGRSDGELPAFSASVSAGPPGSLASAPDLARPSSH
jgi:hypothetical protein